MRNLAILLIVCCYCLSCKENKTDKLIRKWQEVAIIDPDLDETMHEQQVMADTLGATTDSLQNIALYGTNNVDTFKAKMNASLDSFRKQRYQAIHATIFDFKKEGIIEIYTNKGLDTGKWYLDNEGYLIIENKKRKAADTLRRLNIAEVSDTLMKLEYKEKNLKMTTVFKPVKK